MKSALAKMTMVVSLICLNTSSFAQIKGPLYEPTVEDAYKAGHALCSGSGIKLTLKEISTGNSRSAWEYTCELATLANLNSCRDGDTYVVVQPLVGSARSECRTKPV